MNIVDRMQEKFSAATVYGPAVESEGSVVIPAARVIGGGGGGNDKEGNEGGGFGVVARPAGAWVIANGDARWKAAPDLTLLVSGGFLVAISYFYFKWRIARSRARAARRGSGRH